MKNNALALIFVLSMTLVNKDARATHLLGGEITWDCIKSGYNSGKFVFTIKLYRSCVGINLGASATVSNPLYGKYGGPSSISCSKISQREFSYYCYDSTKMMQCYVGNGGANVVEEYIYQSAPIQINGIPDSLGTAFWFSSCCRPSSPVMKNISGSGYFLRSTMYPYRDPGTGSYKSLGSSSGGASCFDSSPQLAEPPSPTVCGKTNIRYDLSYNDKDLDSMRYDWTIPMQSSTSPVTYKTGYNVNSQLPGTFHNTNNVNSVLDNASGIITFKTYSPLGNLHSLGTKVASYKNGQKVAEVFRDLVVVIIDCNTTTSSPQVYNDHAPDIEIKESSSTIYQSTLNKTYQIGSIIELDLRLNDLDSLPTNPVSKQSVELIVTGDAISDTANNSSNCKYAPCAYLDSVGNGAWTGATFRDTTTLTARFYWNTSCVNLNRQNNHGAFFPKTYHFKAHGVDNWCPVPKDSLLNFSITLIDTIGKSRHIDSLDASTGGAFLKWSKSNNSLFTSYEIFRRNNPSGPWTHVTSITNRLTTIYKDNLTRTDTAAMLYKVEINNGSACDIHNIKTIYLEIIDTNLHPVLKWNEPYSTPVNINGTYEIWRQDTLGIWSTVGNGNYGNETFYDPSPIYNAHTRYKIVAFDNEGLSSVSNIDSLRIDSVIPGIAKNLSGGFKIYPNPAKNMLTIDIDNYREEYQISIIDLNGKVVYNTGLKNRRTEIDISEILNGLYFIKIENDMGGVFFKKIIKAK